MPVHIVERMQKMNRAERTLWPQLGREPTLDEIAEEASLTLQQVLEVRAAARASASLDAPVGEAEDAVLGDFVAGDDPLPEEAVELQLRSQALRRALAELPERERCVVELRYGLDGNEPKTLEEIGRMLGLTRERVRQIELDSLRRLAGVREMRLRRARRPMIPAAASGRSGGVSASANALERCAHEARRSSPGRSRPPARARSAGRARPAGGPPRGSRPRSRAAGSRGRRRRRRRRARRRARRLPWSRGRRHERPDALEPAHVVRAGRKRNVQVPAFALPRSALGRKPEVVREPAGCGIDVDGGGENVGALPEDRLRTVAVVGVDVEQGDAAGPGARRRWAATAALFR